MAIPDFQSLMLPVLEESAAGEVRVSDVVALLGTKLALTGAELLELLPSGKQTTFANRVNWAKSYLGKAGLIRLTKCAYFEVRERGRALLANPPQKISIKFLDIRISFVAPDSSSRLMPPGCPLPAYTERRLLGRQPTSRLSNDLVQLTGRPMAGGMLASDLRSFRQGPWPGRIGMVSRVHKSLSHVEPQLRIRLH